VQVLAPGLGLVLALPQGLERAPVLVPVLAQGQVPEQQA
jgi:hypothetical protein